MTAEGRSVGVVISRPIDQGLSLQAELERAGISSLKFPCIEIDAIETPKLRQIAQNLDQYQHLIFTSVNAVEHGMELLQRYWPQWPAEIHWYGVGKTTQAALKRWNICATIPQSSYNSEGLLSLPLLQSVAGARILLVRGVGGRELLADTLRQRGGEVEFAETYVRKVPHIELAQLKQLDGFCRSKSRTFLLASSQEILSNFALLTDNSALDPKQLIIVAVSERIAGFARQRGYDKIAVANGAEDKRILEAIEEWCDNSPSH